ncbi:MAG TPA: hypothetical protein VFN22_07975 [Gemmatimonadales bacterium]|nr:hypothetical protein [Gemmatimonadales bacterium]
MSVTIAQLRLATGTAAELIKPLPSDGALQLFAARAINAGDMAPSRAVVVHPGPPHGPTAGALLDRMASIRAAGHTGIAAPLATGEVNGQGWIIEPLTPPATVAARLAVRGRLSTSETVGLLRDVARALAALHRCGVAHGALGLDGLAFEGRGIILHQLGRSTSTDCAGDWRTLGTLLQEVMSHSPSGRHHLPQGVVDLIARMTTAGITGPALTANEILGFLDRFPSNTTTSEFALVDGVGRGNRDHSDRRTLFLAALAGVLVVLWFLVRGR